MEIDGLVEKITREVLDALSGAKTGSGAPACGRGAAEPRPSAPGYAHATGGDLVLFRGDASQLRALVADRTVGVSPSRSTLVLPRDSGVRRSEAEEQGFSRIVYMDEGQRPVDLVQDCARVIVPVYAFQQLSDLAGLCDACWDVRLILKALCQGRPVSLWVGPIEAPTPFAHKVNGYLGEIASYGIEIMRGAGAVGASAPPTPSYVLSRMAGGRGNAPDSPSPVPGGGPRGGGAGCCGSVCQMKTQGECAGQGQCARCVPERVGIILDHGADRVSSASGVGPVGPDLAKYIDHTLLKPDATREEVLKICEEAREHHFASVCINPAFVRLSAEALRGSDVKVCTVVGFPLGATTSVTKAMETRDAVANGADEIDMVINVGALKAHNDDLVRRDMEAVVEAADGRIVKVILETALLNDEEKVRACRLAREVGVDFVKTSTGFGPGGATAHDVALMRQTVGRYMGVKASGGIRDLAAAQEMIQAGATRIGASASVKIVKGESSPKVAQGDGKSRQPY